MASPLGLYRRTYNTQIRAEMFVHDILLENLSFENETE